MVSVVERAAREKIPVVIFDSGINTENFLAQVSTDNYRGGVLGAERIGKILGGKGKVAMVAVQPGSASTMLREHPRVETATAWIRLAKLADSSLELEMQAYVLTREYDDYTAVRENLLLRVMDIVERCGTSLAYPSQTVYLAREPEAQATNSARNGL